MANDVVFFIVLALTAVLLAVAVYLAVSGKQVAPPRQRPHRDSFRQGANEQPAPRRRAAVIVNPTKFPDLDSIRRRLSAVAAELDWDEPLVLETTAEDPGTGQAKQALAEGVDLVVTLGGDGTVRIVALALVDTGTPLGLLPAGTGNLLARNLELPVGEIEESFRTACTGRNRPVDIGWVTLDPDADGAGERHGFVVMAGIGFDATIMAETSEAAKAKMGWTAYVATGLRNLRGPRVAVTVAVDGGTPVTSRTRTVLIGNCGRLTGGINLMPDAAIDDGLLDCVILSPKGIPGWVAVSATVLTQGRGPRHDRLVRHTGTRFEVGIAEAEPVELDGDVIGTAKQLVATIQPRALLVRVGATVTDPRD